MIVGPRTVAMWTLGPVNESSGMVKAGRPVAGSAGKTGVAALALATGPAIAIVLTAAAKANRVRAGFIRISPLEAAGVTNRRMSLHTGTRCAHAVLECQRH
jgi:hypothetical protein